MCKQGRYMRFSVTDKALSRSSRSKRCVSNQCPVLWPSLQIHKIAGCACAGNSGNVFPTTDFKGNRHLAIPACITARASRTCRDACHIANQRCRGERSRHSRRMCNPQFYVSGKRPIGEDLPETRISILQLQCKYFGFKHFPRWVS